ncbi:hypothetical protein [Agaribacter marinus]|uniref:Uncharacterized protein n=1 Tax=Agaribacter marinus TaxID=1431249 RepID=A0AA37WJE2_9ALTE|nr:hypothetical protein [Agaribacter marinus]GLR72123.1 hypothetical protein GCM10007852_30310 [Agaribacter marinus]
MNQDNDIRGLSKKEVIDIYMGRFQSFPNGQPAKPVDFPAETEVKSDFYTLLVNQSESRIQSYWSRLYFSGRAQPPHQSKSVDEVILRVTKDVSTLAYIPAEHVTNDMRVVFAF